MRGFPLPPFIGVWHNKNNKTHTAEYGASPPGSRGGFLLPFGLIQDEKHLSSRNDEGKLLSVSNCSINRDLLISSYSLIIFIFVHFLSVFALYLKVYVAIPPAIAFRISEISFVICSLSAYHPKKVVGSPQKDDTPLLTPPRAYCGEDLPPCILPEDTTLLQVIITFSCGDIMVIVPVAFPFLELNPCPISVDINLSKERFNLFESNSNFSTSGYPLPVSLS